MVKLYENIKSRRVELHMTQSELAAKVGYADKGMISRVENGKINLSQGQLLKIAQALETTPSALMGWENEPKSTNESTLTDIDIELKDIKVLLEAAKGSTPEHIELAADLLNRLKNEK